MSFTSWVMAKMSRWLLQEEPGPRRGYLLCFKDLCQHAKMGDVLLLEGHNRVSAIVRHITQSPWTHASLYIGRLNEIDDPAMRERVKTAYQGDPDEQLVIESEIGSGTVILPLSIYSGEHLRVLRPETLTEADAQQVVNYAIGRLGMQYDLRQLFDLGRFLFPWGLYPKRWRSSLFQHNALQPTKDICSSMIADAFHSVDYPILPLIEKDFAKEIEFIHRNARLYTPSDFDYSPYFEVIKYPFYPLKEKGAYHHLPWLRDVVSDDEGSKLTILAPTIKQFFTSPAYAVAGASINRTKYGNKVLRCYLQVAKTVYPLNPHEEVVEGLSCLKSINDLPAKVKSLSIVTPPAVTEQLVQEAIAKGIQNIWMQPGAESPLAIQECEEHGINVIAKGPCILKELGFQE